jgi:xanthine dehydrogenase accessory factor
VGGGALEKRVIERAIELLKAGESKLEDYILTDNSDNSGINTASDAEIVPMMCSGSVTVYYDVNKNSPAVYIFGGGHVGKAVLYYLAPLNYHKILIDKRYDYTAEKDLLFFDRFYKADYMDYIEKNEFADGSYFVVVTHGHEYDYEILKRLCVKNSNFSYLGVIASKSKAAGLMKRLDSESVKFDKSKIFTPIGLNIGGNSASEIALAIVSEIQAVRYKNKKVLER